MVVNGTSRSLPAASADGDLPDRQSSLKGLFMHAQKSPILLCLHEVFPLKLLLV